jgi:hypothetical protein
MHSKTRFAVIALLVGLVLLLTGCSTETEVRLYEDEEWVVVNTVTLNLALLPQVGVGGSIIPGIGLEIGIDTGAWSETLLDASLNQIVAEYRAQGVEASWSKRPAGGGEMAYTIRLEGTGWDRLQNVALSGMNMYASVVNLGDDRVQFSLQMPVGETAEGMEFLNYLAQSTFHLRGSRIVSSNAHEVRGGRATWYNPQSITAVVTPARRFDFSNPWVIGGTAVVVVAAGAVITILLLSQRSPPRPQRRVPARRTLRRPRPRRRPPTPRRRR